MKEDGVKVLNHEEVLEFEQMKLKVIESDEQIKKLNEKLVSINGRWLKNFEKQRAILCLLHLLNMILALS